MTVEISFEKLIQRSISIWYVQEVEGQPRFDVNIDTVCGSSYQKARVMLLGGFFHVCDVILGELLVELDDVGSCLFDGVSWYESESMGDVTPAEDLKHFIDGSWMYIESDPFVGKFKCHSYGIHDFLHVIEFPIPRINSCDYRPLPRLCKCLADIYQLFLICRCTV